MPALDITLEQLRASHRPAINYAESAAAAELIKSAEGIDLAASQLKDAIADYVRTSLVEIYESVSAENNKYISLGQLTAVGQLAYFTGRFEYTKIFDQLWIEGKSDGGGDWRPYEKVPEREPMEKVWIKITPPNPFGTISIEDRYGLGVFFEPPLYTVAFSTREFASRANILTRNWSDSDTSSSRLDRYRGLLFLLEEAKDLRFHPGTTPHPRVINS